MSSVVDALARQLAGQGEGSLGTSQQKGCTKGKGDDPNLQHGQGRDPCRGGGDDSGDQEGLSEERQSSARLRQWTATVAALG